MLVVAQIPGWVVGLLIALFLLVSILMILVVLIQRPAGGGLSGAFGSGAGSGQTAFGAKTGDALTIATVTVFFIYLLFAVGLNYAAKPPGAAPDPELELVPPVAPTGGPIDEPPEPALVPEPRPVEPEGEVAPTEPQPGMEPLEPGIVEPGEPAPDPGTP